MKDEGDKERYTERKGVRVERETKREGGGEIGERFRERGSESNRGRGREK